LQQKKEQRTLTTMPIMHKLIKSSHTRQKYLVTSLNSKANHRSNTTKYAVKKTKDKTTA